MDIKIIKEKNNALLNRRELNLAVTFDGATPSRNDVKAKLAAMLNVPLELVIVQKMNNEFGKQEMNVYVKIYEDAARMKQVEEAYVLERNKLPEPEVVEEEEAPAEEAAEETTEE
ncbi:30S ribosomal protein S24e [Methanolobus sp. WCC1]|jgi:small subunit ribosomal protein S24e|uniref:Small ribosomal subunit protein eS24 n=1 Tax=Methanolobus tindarius DSM 2278 TaxID=1090322 RepID=W9DQV8_METTI|nr:30S ribosomal protein S24e [Methanolobus tindarius]ETA69009.1 ribosomal protein S24E [Methanolobus tindarius DSM 2278]MDI3485953.1 small subunit ribosomal protein S24e [Methanolobus sp.]